MIAALNVDPRGITPDGGQLDLIGRTEMHHHCACRFLCLQG
jgi:hypothetical protein